MKISFSNEAPKDPTRQLAKDAVSFHSYQSAMQAVLEMLGSRSSMLPVVCSVFTAPDVMSAILRSGAQPILLDVDEETAQINIPDLQDLLTSLHEAEKEAVILLNRPAGAPVDPSLVAATSDVVTVEDTHVFPDPLDDSLSQFAVWDLSTVEKGAIVRTPFDVQRKDLVMIRDGFLGHDSGLSNAAKKALQEMPSMSITRINAKKYRDALASSGKEGLVAFAHERHTPFFVFNVPNADRVIAHLYSYGIEAKKAFFPLHEHPQMASRWHLPPEYPVAERLSKRLLAVPTNHTVSDHIEEVVARVLEVSDE